MLNFIQVFCFLLFLRLGLGLGLGSVIELGFGIDNLKYFKIFDRWCCKHIGHSLSLDACVFIVYAYHVTTPLAVIMPHINTKTNPNPNPNPTHLGCKESPAHTHPHDQFPFQRSSLKVREVRAAAALAKTSAAICITLRR